MKRKIKSIISFLLMMILVITSVPIESKAASNIVINGIDIGYANNSYFTKNGKSCANSKFSNGRCHKNNICDSTASSECNCMRYWPTGVKSTCQVDLLGSQCIAFARYCQWRAYGSFATGTNSSYSDLTGTISKSNCTEATLKAKLKGCAPATHVRMPSPHSISILSTSDSGLTFADCNSDGYCKVKVRTYTWSEFASYVQGKGGITYTYAWKKSIPVTNHTVDSKYSNYVPINTYAISKSNINVYDANGTKYSNRYITGSSDLCIIQEIYTDGWCKVKYPSSAESSGYFTAYAKLTEFISSASPSSWTASGNATAYRRSSGSDTIGSVSKGDKGLKVSSANGRTQVIYPVSGQSYYKMGWIAESGSNNSGNSGTTSASYLVPCKTYAIGTGKISVYDSNHTKYSNRYITGSSDLCTINAIYTDGWCKVTYPSSAESSGYFTAYAPLSSFIPNASPKAWTATGAYTAYRRSTGSDTIGSVSKGDSCVVVSEENGRIQVMYPVSGQSYYKMGWLPTSISHNPIGTLDSASGDIYSVSLAGWAYDEDNVNACLDIHVYVGGTYVGALNANLKRTDVNSAYGCGEYHGFSGTIQLDKSITGSQKIEVFAINVGGGSNALVGSKTVTIGTDTTAPVISNIKVSDVTSEGYTVTCTVTDDHGVDRVQFPTWTAYNGQDDLFADWTINPAASGTANGTTYTYKVYTSAHNYEGGIYATHIYAYDKYGNCSDDAANNIMVPIEVSDVFLNTYSLTFDTIGAQQVLKAEIIPSDATNQAITWSSSNSAVATVKNGVVTAVGSGTATITATSNNGVIAECEVSVNEPYVTGISIIQKPEKLIYYQGESLDTDGLVVKVLYSNGSAKEITSGFSCTPTVLDVVGNTEITIAYAGKTAKFNVNVEELPSGALEICDGSAKPGESVTVAVKMNSNPGIIAARLKLEYDIENLSLIDVNDGGILGESLFGNNLAEVPYYMSWENGLASSNYTGTGELVYLTFKVKEDAPAGVYKINLSYDEEEIYDINLRNVYFDVVGGVIEVEEQSSSAVIAKGYSGDTTWVLTDDGVLTFSGKGAIKNYTSKTAMPWYEYNSNIEKVVLEHGITKIGNYAFYGMPELTSVTIPESVESIGEYAFKNSTALKQVMLPSNLTQLGESAFYGCTSLTEIDIPASLYTVKPYTFKNCTKLEKVTFHEGNLMKLSDGAFYGTALAEISIPDCVSIVDVYCFKNCSKLASVKLSANMTQIREAAFYGTAIPTIVIPEGVTKIGPYAFKNCVKLESISLPETLTSVGEASFYACTGLKEITFPDAVTTIGNYAFRKCELLKTVDFSKNLQTIGESSFYGCASLLTLDIPAKVTSIKGYAFKGCENLLIVKLPDSLRELGESAFYACTELDSIRIPENVTTVGAYAFSRSNGLKTVEFTGNAPAIGSGAFAKVTATVIYPSEKTGWTSAVRQNYGGTLTWIAK